jgi:hypothetical protein
MKQIRRAAIQLAGVHYNDMRLLADFFFLILFFLVLGAWLMLWAMFHIAGGLIHLLLIIAAISLILHLVRGRRVA